MERESVIVAAVMGAVVVVRLWLLVRFWRNSRGKRLAISTAQLLVVIGAAIAGLRFAPDHFWAILSVALAVIVGLSFIPVQRSKNVIVEKSPSH